MLPASDPLLVRLGPAVLPFERSTFNREVMPGEDIIFLDYIISLESGTIPTDCLRCDTSDTTSLPIDRKYLWVIDHEGLRIIHEMTPNSLAARGHVCHTNITGRRKALQGGELWFDLDNTIYINNQSGRFKAVTIDQRQAVLDYFRQLGFAVVQLPNRPG
jgi:hypothetical protein